MQGGPMLDFSVLTPKIAYEFALRWTHFLAGVTWIGFLYWFNLVNVNFQKGLDPELKPKVNPGLILPTLFYFRWGAVLTWLTGFLYYSQILMSETATGMGKPVMAWIAIVGVTYAIIYAITRPEGAFNNGNLLAAAVAVLVSAMAFLIFKVYGSMGVTNNSSYAIGIGGGMGTIMFLNVWGIIWPIQKRLLGLVPLKEGQDKGKLARRAFLASRTNAWLSIPMLMFMGISSHLSLIRWN
jgi:uncharacterized membrane protein